MSDEEETVEPNDSAENEAPEESASLPDDGEPMAESAADEAADPADDAEVAGAGDPVASSATDDEPNAHEDDSPTPDAAAEEEQIRHELGIGGGKIELDHSEIDQLLADAVIGYEQVFSQSITTPDLPGSVEGLPGELASGGDMVAQNLTLLRDVNLKVKVELGRGRMYLKDILRLGQGSVVELERLAGDPLDIYVNEKVIARGEVLVLNENFCIRITEIYSPAEALLGTT